MALRFVLDNQYVRLGDHPGAWRVLRGSGMGVACSGEVSDAAFLWLAEDGVINSPSFKQEVGLVEYFRFKDDIIAFLDGPRIDLERFKTELAARAMPFILEVESVNNDVATFLDVQVRRSRSFSSSGLLDFSVYVKRSSQWVPLSTDSCHHPSVHAAWPKAMVARYRRLCKHPSDADTHVQHFCSQLRSAGACQSIIQNAMLPATPKSSRQGGGVPRVFMVLPFCPTVV